MEGARADDFLSFITGRNNFVEFRSQLGIGPDWQVLPGSPHNTGSVLDTNSAPSIFTDSVAAISARFFSGQFYPILIYERLNFAAPQEKAKVTRGFTHIMKIRLCHNQNGYYLKTIRDWKLATVESLNFSTVAEAREFCHQQGLADMRIVVDYENGNRPAVIFLRNPSAQRSTIRSINLHHLRERCREMERSAST